MALVLTALIGMLGIAIDGGRLYVDRRVLQNAADSAALAAADAYAANLHSSGGSAPKCNDQSGTQTTAVGYAYAAGAQEFANQIGQAYSGGYTLNGPTEASYSVADYKLVLDELVPANSADAGSLKVACVFEATVTHALWMAFVPVIGGTSTSGACSSVAFPCQEVKVQAQAISAASIPIPNAWVFILDPSTSSGPFPCGNGTSSNSLNVSGTGNVTSLTVAGTIISDGNINWNGNPTAVLNNGGDMIDHCDASAPYPAGDVTYNGGGSYMQSPTTFGDPFGPQGLDWANSWWGPFASRYTTQNPSNTGTAVELAPGEYTTDPSFPGGCWFLEPGQYQWDKGLSAHSGQGLVSNELMPPGGEDSTSAALSNESLFSWNGGQSGGSAGAAGCVGKIAADVTLGSTGSSTTYYLRAASARQETVAAGTACTGGCWRESYFGGNNANACVSATVKSDGSVQVGISNVPGEGNKAGTSVSVGGGSTQYTPANRYDIYASTSPCSDTTITDWHYVSSATFDTTGAQTQSGIGSCPATPATSAPVDSYVTTGGCTLGGVISASISAGSLSAAVMGGTNTCALNTPVTDTVNGATHTIAGWTVGCTHPYQLNNANCKSPNNIDGTTYCYDVANEHYCLTTGGPGNYCNFYEPQQTYTTPGGVLFYIPSTASTGGNKCIDTTGNGAQYYVYGTDALYDVVLYMPDNCSGNNAQINGGAGGSFVGWGYAPGHNDNPKLAGNGSPFSGGIVTWDLTLDGTAGLTVPGGVPSFLFTTSLGSKLLICTNTTPGCPTP